MTQTTINPLNFCGKSDIAFPFTMLGLELREAIIPVIYTRNEWESCSFMPLFYKNVERDKIILQ